MCIQNKIRSALTSAHPLIHCITNPISIHQCANAVLAVGGRPMMAEHPLEVQEITKTAGALLLNLGNITDVRMEAMKRSAQTAKENGIPVVIDAVGIACSALRRRFLQELLQISAPVVIKGNYSEICALWQPQYTSSGVDAQPNLSREDVTLAAVQIARQWHTAVLASGQTDVVTDGTRVAYVTNGTPQLATVTGTGCMLGALCACYSAVDIGYNAAVTACAVLGICGSLAQTTLGSGSFMVSLMDHLSTLSCKALEQYISLEEKDLE